MRFVVNKVALEQVFSKYFGFPCQFPFHLLLYTHHHHHRHPGLVQQDK
jgi:fatty acid desaturase